MQILAGAIPACILALVIDAFMGILERVVVPEGLTIGNSQSTRPVKKSTKIIVSILCACLLLASIGSRLMAGSNKEALHIGSSDMSEQLILGNMYADMIEAKTDYKGATGSFFRRCANLLQCPAEWTDRYVCRLYRYAVWRYFENGIQQ